MAPAKSKASDLSSTPHPPYFQVFSSFLDFCFCFFACVSFHFCAFELLSGMDVSHFFLFNFSRWFVKRYRHWRNERARASKRFRSLSRRNTAGLFLQISTNYFQCSWKGLWNQKNWSKWRTPSKLLPQRRRNHWRRRRMEWKTPRRMQRRR